MKIDLSSRVALVTGAAGNLGRAAAQRLIDAGARVTLVDRELASLERVFPNVGAGEEVRRVAADLLDPKSELRWILENKTVFRLKEELKTEPKFWYYTD